MATSSSNVGTHSSYNIVNTIDDEDIKESTEKFERAYKKTIGFLTLGICIASFVIQSLFITRLPLDLYLKDFLRTGIELKGVSRATTYNLVINQEDEAIQFARGDQNIEFIDHSEGEDNTPSAINTNISATLAIISSPEYQPTIKYLLKLSFVFSLFICVPAYLWYIAVNLTTMANLTAIYNISCFFAYLFSIFFLGEDLKLVKIFSVFLSIIGVLIMSYLGVRGKDVENDESNTNLGYGENGYPKHEIAGNFIALIGASLYGLYEVLFKKYLSPPTTSILFSNTIVALMGIFTILILWIPIPLLHFLELEKFSLPDLNTFLYVMLIAIMGVMFNASFMFVIALTSPLFASIGIMLTIPIVAWVDMLITHHPLEINTILGSFSILVAFGLLTWDNSRKSTSINNRDRINGRTTESESEVEQKQEFVGTPGEKHLYEKLKERFNPSRLIVHDISGGCGDMYAIEIASSAFSELSMVKQHRLVTETLKDDIAKMHGVQLKTSAK
ncbi:10171_t:CDS:2 [Ambispora leptoticha]|uniref:10171_t:CDS:1 n=1 Tax=Ambispora leptoticha TaxID=144679 RepID=A0A9N8ZCJ5_9GLOM|nr:10171_t:CDS:2 [Ambispora leptoticha]